MFPREERKQPWHPMKTMANNMFPREQRKQHDILYSHGQQHVSQRITKTMAPRDNHCQQHVSQGTTDTSPKHLNEITPETH